ncbi:MAG: ABC transporter permease [Candidatus Izimaplasma sp.]|nr:ABC transporter permease [Candidatus Izimaplasma bacterium]
MVGLVGVVIIVLLAVVGPWISPYDYSDQLSDYSNLPPRLDIREVGDTTFHVTRIYRLLELEDGIIVDRYNELEVDVINKINYYAKEIVLPADLENTSTYPLPATETLDANTYYSESWGIALTDGEYTFGDDAILVTYIHPDSPLHNLEFEGGPYDISDAVYFSELTTIANYGEANAADQQFDIDLGAESIVEKLDETQFIEEIRFFEAEVKLNYSYGLLNDNLVPTEFKDVDYTIEYKGDESLYTTDTIANKLFYFGSDSQGRDILTRVLYGARISLIVALIATLVNFIIGVTYGAVAGYLGGNWDNVMMRIVDIINSIPLVLWVILLMVVLREVVIDVTIAGKNYVIFRGTSGLGTIAIALGTVYWVAMARLVRGQVLGLKEQEFVLVARTIGVSNYKIISRHLIPNALGPIIVSMAMMIPAAVFTEAFLSFIGLGVSAPQASLGTLANAALSGFQSYPFKLFFPAAMIALMMLAFNFLGDGLRDALDPRLRKG